MKAGCKILIIDDEEIVRMSCKRSLILEGYDVDVASSGDEGLALFENNIYDLVLIDLKMPGIDGIDVLLKIKKKRPDQKVIMMTGYDIEENIDAIALLGVEHCLVKPFTPDALIEIINSELHKYQ